MVIGTLKEIHRKFSYNGCSADDKNEYSRKQTIGLFATKNEVNDVYAWTLSLSLSFSFKF